MGRRRPLPVEVRTALATAHVHVDPRHPGGRTLRLDGQDTSYVDLDDPTRLAWSYVRRIGDLADLLAPPGVPLATLHLGGGACTLARYVAATRPGSDGEVWELDPGVVDLARRHLGLRPGPGLRVHVGDAGEGLAERADASADLVVLDAFAGPLVPAHLATVEAFREVRRVLRPAGALAVNAIDLPPLELVRALCATLLEVFAHVVVVAEDDVLEGSFGGNVVLLASGAPLPVAGLLARAQAADDPHTLIGPAETAGFAASARVLRDGEPFAHRLARLSALWGAGRAEG
jgi:SAM-dependent methyltransferase